ncbi:MAG: hypothetical protein ACOXZ9_02050 [Bacteroidales bacterium]|jgi:hypothetical protein
MNHKKIFWGVILIIVGVLLLLHLLDIVVFTSRIFRLAIPVLIMLWGVTLLEIKSSYKLIISILIVLLSVLLASYKSMGIVRQKGYYAEYNRQDRDRYQDQDRDRDPNAKPVKLYQAFDSTTTDAKLILNVGAGEYSIDDTCNNYLAIAEVEKEVFRENFAFVLQKDEPKEKVLEFSISDENFKIDNFDLDVNLKLNQQPVWDFEMNIGAADVDFDLSKFKVRNIKLAGGAADIEITVGDLFPQTDILVETGAANVTIKVPYQSGVEITKESALSSTNFIGFEKVDGKYRSSDYSKAKNFINIDFKSGLSSISVERY